MKVGDVVKLISGDGPLMTVEVLPPYATNSNGVAYASVVWFDKENVLHRNIFDRLLLTVLPNKENE